LHSDEWGGVGVFFLGGIYKKGFFLVFGGKRGLNTGFECGASWKEMLLKNLFRSYLDIAV